MCLIECFEECRVVGRHGRVTRVHSGRCGARGCGGPQPGRVQPCNHSWQVVTACDIRSSHLDIFTFNDKSTDIYLVTVKDFA